MGICSGGGDKGLSEKPKPLDALLRRARAWEMESRDGAVRSSSRESDRQMGSDGNEEEGSWRFEGVGGDDVEVTVRGLWIHRPSYRKNKYVIEQQRNLDFNNFLSDN